MSAWDDYVQRWGKFGDDLRKQLVSIDAELQRSILRLEEQAKNALRPIIEAQEQINRAAANVTLSQSFLSQLVLPQIELSNYSMLTEITKSAVAAYAGLGPVFEELERSARELPPIMSEALLTLGKHGWYLDFDWTEDQLLAFRDALSTGDTTAAEQELIKHFEARVDSIEESLVEKFPHRARFFRAAFAAHRRQEYELSIPALFTQADGISYERTKKSLFMKKNKRPGVAAYVDEFVTDALQLSLLSAICNTLPISASADERAASAEVLNRHTVLHGESLTYPTRENSLKTISFINYVAEVL